MKRIKQIAQNNKGSGLVMVVIAVAFLTLIASIALVTNYTMFVMKSGERKGKENYYDATSVMEEVKAVMQNVASDSIRVAYNEALPRFSSIGVNVSQVFGARYQELVLGWKGNDQSLFVDDPQLGYQLQTSVLESLITDTRMGESDSVSITCGDLKVGNGEKDPYSVELTDLTVTFEHNGRETSLSCDLKLACPDIVYALTHQTVTGLPEYATVCNKTLSVGQDGDVSINGNVFADNVNFSLSNTALTLKGGALTCKHKLGFSTGVSNCAFKAVSSAALWAEDIEVGASSTMELLGTTYVANDLSIEGQHAAITLAGTYFGFGNDLEKPACSSSIIANQQFGSIDMQNLQTLTLAGITFIGGDDTVVDKKSAQTGESVSAKVNEQAYLIPVTMLRKSGDSTASVSNPSLGATAITSGYTVATDQTLWMIGNKTMKCGDYGIKATPKIINLPYAGNYVTYFFFDFDTPAHRSTFFKDYFTQNHSDIDKYLTVTFNASQYATRGNGYDGTNFLSDLQDEAADVSLSALSMNRQFTSLCTNLTTSLSPDAETAEDYYNLRAGTALNVYESIITKTVVDAQTKDAVLEFTQDGKTVGIVVNGDYTVDTNSRNDNVRIIIASGDVKVNRDMQGVIIAGGNITLNANLKSDSEGVVNAFAATLPNGKSIPNGKGGYVAPQLSYFFTDKVGQAGTSTTAADAWDVQELIIVSYQRKK